MDNTINSIGTQKNVIRDVIPIGGINLIHTVMGYLDIHLEKTTGTIRDKTIEIETGATRETTTEMIIETMTGSITEVATIKTIVEMIHIEHSVMEIIRVKGLMIGMINIQVTDTLIMMIITMVGPEVVIHIK